MNSFKSLVSQSRWRRRESNDSTDKAKVGRPRCFWLLFLVLPFLYSFRPFFHVTMVRTDSMVTTDSSGPAFVKYMNKKRIVGSQAETPLIKQVGNTLKVGGYQTYWLNLQTNNMTFKNKIGKFEYIKSVLSNLYSNPSVTTLTDIGCSAGEISFIAQRVGYKRINCLDHDSEYVSTVAKLVSMQDLNDVVFPRQFSFGEQFDRSDIVVCGALIHWVFSCTADFGDFNAIMEYLFASVGKFLLIEWVDPMDPAIRIFHHLACNSKPTKEAYNAQNFERALSNYGRITSKKAVDGLTRVMYLVESLRFSPNSSLSSSGARKVVKSLERITNGSLEITEHEVCILNILQQFPWSQRFLSSSNDEVLLSDVGKPVSKKTLPSNYKEQLQQILEDMQSVGVHHNLLITKYSHNIMEKDGKLSVVNFSVATVNGSSNCVFEESFESMFANIDIFDDSQMIEELEERLGLKFVKYLDKKRKVGSQSEIPTINRIGSTVKVNGYQGYWLDLKSHDMTFKNKVPKFNYIKSILDDLHSTSGATTLTDIGCSGGEISFIAEHLGYNRIDCLDHDPEYVSTVEKLIVMQQLTDIVYPKVFSFGERFRESDVVVCGAIIHWVFSCTADFGDFNVITKYLLDSVKKFLLIEWIDPKDPAIMGFHHLNCNSKPTIQVYSVENFELALSRYGTIISKKAVDGPTRVMYLVQSGRILN